MILMMKKLLKWSGLLLVAVVFSFVTNSYVREIQESIHKGIGWSYDQFGRDTGDFLYDLNGVVFNGKGFDGERDIKHAINRSYKSIDR